MTNNINHNIADHSRFEELCALSAIGEITPADFETLSAHMRECSECREAYSEFSNLTHAQLPMVASESLEPGNPSGILAALRDKRHKDRFAQRARENGIELSPARVDPTPSVFAKLQLLYQPVSAVVIVALLVAGGVLQHRAQESRQREVAASAEIANLSGRMATLQEQLSDLQAAKHDAENIPAKNLVPNNVATPDLSSRVTDLERQLASASLTIQQLQSAGNDAKERLAQAQQELADVKQSAAAANLQFAQFRTSHPDVDPASIADHVQIADLERRVKEQQEVVEKQQKLLAVDSDVRNLMAARSLHITDVFDVDGKGKKKSAFGRVFYTEGKSLVFYAFDLDGPKLPAGKETFQAWGQLASSSTSAVNLGIFYVDDPAQKRWMLKFDNPEILQQLSAVFVTAEPHGGGARPTGQKLMYAYVGHDPNHP